MSECLNIDPSRKQKQNTQTNRQSVAPSSLTLTDTKVEYDTEERDVPRATCVEVVAEELGLQGLAVSRGQGKRRGAVGNAGRTVHIGTAEHQAQCLQDVTALHIDTQRLGAGRGERHREERESETVD